ncbi:SusC/RagA family TonB-linked outer membrane protein [Ravibacter arvi]|uniref:SusC/RagA family TonB-linked outer membrane protein n=2 Tax=Ravibacter arvi TaxID=2051041 RepID=A0ABP8M1Y3_9BACT
MSGAATAPGNIRGEFPPLQPAGEYAATLRDLLILLRNKHKVNILFEDKLVNHPAAGTRLSGNATLEQNLTRILQPYHLSFKKVGEGVYVITKAGKDQEGTSALPVPFPAGQEAFANIPEPAGPLSRSGAENNDGPSAYAAGREIRGKVTDENGEPLPGVSILLKGTQQGTISDAEGIFSLPAVNTGDVLVFSFVGYLPQELVAGNSSSLEVTLKVDVKTLTEVVVTALGIERDKKALGYSAQEIKGSDLTEARESNIANSLKGRVAGLHVNSSSSGPGGSSYVVIRGASSLTGDNQPLYVVDGVPIDNQTLDAASPAGGRDFGDGVGNINPDDVESMTVLKGPSAAALYGARGANGVILITTKKGTKKKGIGVDFNSNATFETPNVLPRYQNVWGGGYGGTYSSFGTTTQNGVEYPLWTNSMYDHWGGKMDGRMIVMAGMPEFGPVAYNPQPDDNIREFYRVGQTFTNTIAVSGGDKNTSVRLSVSDLHNRHILPTSSYNRQTINLNFSSAISNKLNIEGRVNYVRQEGTNRPELGYTTSSGNPAIALNLLSRFVDLDWLRNYKRADGSMINYIVRAPHNPYWIANEFLSDDKRDRMMGYIKLRYQITPWLDFQARTGTDFYGDVRNERIGIGTTGASTIRGQIKSADWKAREDNSDFLLTASGKMNGVLSGSFSVGGNRLDRYQSVTGFTGTNLILDNVYHISNAGNVVPRSGITRKRMHSLYAMGQIAYKDVLFLDVTGRNDWSSTLGIDNRSFFYPSTNLSFVFSEAADLNFRPLSFGKIRVSYAQAGRDANPFQTTAGYTLLNAAFADQKFAQISSRIPLLNLKNELKTSYELGADLRFFANRVGVDFTYYYSETKNQIVPLPLSATTGFSDRVINAGNISNKGFELLLTLKPFSNPNGFSWNTIINLSQNKSKVIELYDGVESISLITQTYANIEARPGQPYGNIVGYKYLRNDEGRLLLTDAGRLQRTTEKAILGNIQPDLLGGLTNEFFYKGVTLSALVDIRKGGQVFSYTKYNEMANGTGKFTQERGDGLEMLIDGVILKPDGSYMENNIPVTPQNYYAPRAWSNMGEEFVIDASYVSLREITLGYTFPSKLTTRTPFRSVKLSAVARNLAYFYRDPQFRMMGVSPESATNSSTAAQGIQAHSLPTTRSLGFNLSLSF